ncbi:cytochrome P450 [Mycena capillaripes]|nr:cytochrome P450 [Mycena capillaripes]
MAYTTALTVILSTVALYLIFGRKSLIRHIAGPPSPSWVFGNMRQLLLAARYGDYEFEWLKHYGPVYRTKGCFGQDRLMVADPLALQFLLNSPTVTRSPNSDNTAELMFGEKSVITARGNEHRRLRAAMNPGFTAAAVRNYQPMLKKAAEMVSDEFETFSGAPTDVCPILSIATLNAISEAILGHPTEDLGEEFVASNVKIVYVVNSITQPHNIEPLCSELAASRSAAHILADSIGSRLPTWLWRAAINLPTQASTIARTERSLAKKVGGRLVQEKLDAARLGLEMNNDLFSTLLNPDASDTTRALSEDDIIAQTAIILIAGQETTANSLAFGLLELARHPDLQEKLRAEIHATLGGTTKQVAYDNMPLLNAFIKETLRLYPAVPVIDRIASQDTVIPLAESITTSTGERISQIPVQKGQILTIATAAYQRLPSCWGHNTDTFDPSRWLDGTISPGDAVGPYANLLTFMGGPRACLGWRFAILEIQTIICEVVSKFSFTEPDNEPIQPRVMTALLPIAKTGKRGLPLCVSRIL